MGRHGLAKSSRPRSEKVQKENYGGEDGVIGTEETFPSSKPVPSCGMPYQICVGSFSVIASTPADAVRLYDDFCANAISQEMIQVKDLDGYRVDLEKLRTQTASHRPVIEPLRPEPQVDPQSKGSARRSNQQPPPYS